MSSLDLGELITKPFNFLFHDFGYILLYLLPVLTSLVFSVLLLSFGGFDFLSPTTSFQDPTQISAFLVEQLPLFIVLIFIFIIINLIVTTLAIIGIIKKAEMQDQGKHLSVAESFHMAFPLFPKVFATMILFAVILILPFVGIIALSTLAFFTQNISLICVSSLVLLLMIIPWFYLYLRLSLYAQACVIGEYGPVGALKESWRITKGSVLIIFAAILIYVLILFVIILPISLIFSNIPDYAFLSTIINQIVTLIFGPVLYILLTLVYLRLTKKQPSAPMSTPQTIYDLQQ